MDQAIACHLPHWQSVLLSRSLSRPKNFRTHTIHPSIHSRFLLCVVWLLLRCSLHVAGQPHVEQMTFRNPAWSDSVCVKNTVTSAWYDRESVCDHHVIATDSHCNSGEIGFTLKDRTRYSVNGETWIVICLSVRFLRTRLEGKLQRNGQSNQSPMCESATA